MDSQDAFAPDPVAVCPLASVISGGDVMLLNKTNTFRRYVGGLVTSSRIAGNDNQDVKLTDYRVGARNQEKNLTKLMGQDKVPEVGIICAQIKLNDDMKHELSSKSKKAIINSPDYDVVDFGGVICRLGGALAYYSIHGTLSTGTLRSARPLKIRSLDVVTTSIFGSGDVLVPSNASFEYGKGAFVALVNAICGEGGSVLTDIVCVNPNTNAALVPTVANSTLAEGCVNALRVLLNLYAQSGASALAAFCLAKGVTSVLSVAGHSDEGGYIRDVLRNNKFALPHGGIMTGGVNAYMNFPVMHELSFSGFQTLVDAIALRTAGASSLCDPLVDINGLKFPTTYTSRGDIAAAGADTDDLAEAEQRHLKLDMARNSGLFCSNYARALGRHLLGDDSGHEQVTPILNTLFWAEAERDGHNQHVTGAVVVPYYWVEPTSLFTHRDDSLATNEGYGIMAGTQVQETLPAYPDAKVLNDNGDSAYVIYTHRSARTVPAIVHMNYHRGGGLGSLIPWQVMVNEVALVGKGQTEDNPLGDTMEEALLASKSMDAYLWRHSATTIPSPAEFMVISGSISAKIVMGAHDEGTGIYNFNEVVAAADTRGLNTVSYLARRPALHKLVEGYTQNKRVAPARTRALRILGARSLSHNTPLHILMRGSVRPGVGL